ncbi:HET-domain-containing protein, partial [Plenodomus tracheiphilus IPT5]
MSNTKSNALAITRDRHIRHGLKPDRIEFLSQYFPNLRDCKQGRMVYSGDDGSLLKLCLMLDDGCDLCKCLSLALQKYSGNLEGPVQAIYKKKSCLCLDYKPSSTRFPTYLLLTLYGSSRITILHFKLQLPDPAIGPRDDPIEVGSGPSFYRSSNLPAQLDICQVASYARRWLQECEKFHTECATGSLKWYPRRVLDLSSREEGSIKLLETGGTVLGPYATVSYCWGKSSLPIKTTLETLEQHLQNLQWDNLPICFQEMIQICWAIGIEYLWIDAICIIQDSPEDWELESAVMGTIYANARLTLAVTALQNPSESVLRDRYILSRFRGFEERWPLASVIVSQGRRTSRFSAYSPLNSRGWVMQERLLSPRTLFFHASELAWECTGSTLCECGHLDVRHLDSHDQERYSGHLQLRRMLHEKTGLEDDDVVCDVWMSLLARYASLNLSYGMNRLAALSGLAARFDSGVYGQYIAGIWTGMLPQALSYRMRCSCETPHYRGLTDSHAPSWSWASAPLCQSPYIYSYGIFLIRDKCPTFELVSVDVKHREKNPFGWTEFARLTIRAKVLQCSVSLQTKGIKAIYYLYVNRKEEETDSMPSDLIFRQFRPDYNRPIEDNTA